MLVDVTAEIGLSSMRSQDQHLRGSRERVANVAEKIVLGPDAARVLARLVAMLLHRLDARIGQMLNVRSVVIDQNDGLGK